MSETEQAEPGGSAEGAPGPTDWVQSGREVEPWALVCTQAAAGAGNPVTRLPPPCVWP